MTEQDKSRAEQNWKNYVSEAWVTLRKHNQSIPDEVLDEMRAILLHRALPADAAPSGWLSIESAPKDGSHFHARIDGLPYRAFFDERGRFIRVTHSNASRGRSYQVHKILGKELLEVIEEATPDSYVATQMIWQSGFEHKPTHWMPLPSAPDA